MRNLVIFIGMMSMGLGAAAQMAPGASGGPPPEMQAKLAELQTIRVRLDAAREKVMAAPAVKAAADELQKLVEGRMKKLDPKAKAQIERFEAIRKEVEAAMATNNREKAMALLPEVQTLSANLDGLQKKALAAPEIQKKSEAFQKLLAAEMQRVDPGLPPLLARAEKLMAELQAAMPPGMMPPGPRGGPPPRR